MRRKIFKKLKMSSRKCYVCSCKSSLPWFKVSEELQEDVYACFNIKETVVLGDESLTFCASCRRNLTRWRESRPTNGKHLKIANSRGKPFLNNAPIAWPNRKLALFRRNLSEISSLFQLPEGVFFVGCCFFGRFRYLEVETNMQPCKPNYLHVKLSVENIVGTWFSRQNHLDESVLSNSSLAYKLFYLFKVSTERNRAQLFDFVDKLKAKGNKLLEENAELKHQLNNLHVQLQSLQNDPDPTTPVTKLQEQVHCITLHIFTFFLSQMKLNVIYSAYIWVNNINKTLSNWGKYGTPTCFSN